MLSVEGSFGRGFDSRRLHQLHTVADIKKPDGTPSASNHQPCLNLGFQRQGLAPGLECSNAATPLDLVSFHARDLRVGPPGPIGVGTGLGSGCSAAQRERCRRR